MIINFYLVIFASWRIPIFILFLRFLIFSYSLLWFLVFLLIHLSWGISSYVSPTSASYFYICVLLTILLMKVMNKIHRNRSKVGIKDVFENSLKQSFFLSSREDNKQSCSWSLWEYLERRQWIWETWNWSESHIWNICFKWTQDGEQGSEHRSRMIVQDMPLGKWKDRERESLRRELKINLKTWIWKTQKMRDQDNLSQMTYECIF